LVLETWFLEIGLENWFWKIMIQNLKTGGIGDVYIFSLELYKTRILVVLFSK